MVRETRLAPEDLVQPFFVVPGEDVRAPIRALDGVYHLSIDRCVDAARQAAEAGVGGILLFGLPGHKDEAGTAAYDDEGIVQLATRALKRALPDLPVITD